MKILMLSQYFYPEVGATQTRIHEFACNLIQHGHDVTAVGGIPDAVAEGTNGYLVPVEDSQALAQKLKLLLSDADLREKMGLKNREKARQHYHPDVMANKLADLYYSLI